MLSATALSSLAANDHAGYTAAQDPQQLQQGHDPHPLVGTSSMHSSAVRSRDTDALYGVVHGMLQQGLSRQCTPCRCSAES
jgi:hypothetical protein